MLATRVAPFSLDGLFTPPCHPSSVSLTLVRGDRTRVLSPGLLHYPRKEILTSRGFCLRGSVSQLLNHTLVDRQAYVGVEHR